MSFKNLILFVLSASLVIGVILSGACAGKETETPKQEIPTQIAKDITPQEALNLIQKNKNNPNFIILDVRTPEEFAEEHIEKAINIDFYAKDFQDELNELDKHKTYLVYCRSGVRSKSALTSMADLNFIETYNILGGINQWKAEGLPTTK